jgi:hypothetical protein
MNAKRWFPYACLALMLVSEIFLFRANHERDKALADVATAQQQLHDTQAELDALKNSSAGAQAAEITSLHKQNDLLTAKSSGLQQNVDRLQQTVDRLQKESQQTAEHLTTARSALEMQQAHLQQLQTEQQQAVAVANANACINNLRQIDAAKNQWALEKQKNAGDLPTVQDLAPYLRDGVLPVCPDGGTYTLNGAGLPPTCSIPGHVLPQ